MEKTDEMIRELDLAHKDIDAFSTAISHDLRSPLNHIYGFSQRLRKTLAEETPEQKRYFDVIQNSALKMQGLIDVLMAYFKVGRRVLALQDVALTDIVKGVQSSIKQEKKIQWTIDDLGTVHADKTLMQNLFEQLLGNAEKFSRPAANPAIHVGRETDATTKKPVFFVKDNGVGFEGSQSPKLFGIFERFHSSDEFPGSGIGLAMAARIIARHNGRIWIESEVDKGTTVRFSF